MKLNQNNRFLKQDLLSKTQIVNLSISFLKFEGQIKGYSKDAPEFFGYSEQNFHFLKTINSLIPEPVSANHNAIIQYQFDNMQLQLLKRGQVVIMKKKSQIIERVNMFVNINFLQAFDLIFECFFEPFPYQNPLLIFDSQLTITGVNKEFNSLISPNEKPDSLDSPHL